MKKSIKIIIAVIIAILIIIIGLIAYFIFKPESRPWYPDYNINTNINGGVLPNINEATNQPPSNVNTSSGLPGVDTIAKGDLTFTNLVKRDTRDTLLTNTNDFAYYDENTGGLYRFVPGSEPELLTDDVYLGAEKVTFSPNADKAIIEFPDGSNIMYDTRLDKQYTLPKEMEDFSFNETGSQIAYKYMGEAEFDRWYATSNPDGTGVNAIDLLGNNGDKVTIDWSPAGQIVGHWWEAKEGLQLEIKFLGEHDENFASTIVRGIGFVGQWTPDGQKMIYSVSNVDTDLQPELWIVDANPGNIGRNMVDLGVRTWADKCTMTSDSSTIYCAVPINLDSGAGLAREVADDNPDEIYKIDLINGIRKKIAIPVDDDGLTTKTIKQLFIDEEEGTLYYVENGTGDLESIKLK